MVSNLKQNSRYHIRHFIWYNHAIKNREQLIKEPFRKEEVEAVEKKNPQKTIKKIFNRIKKTSTIIL